MRPKNIRILSDSSRIHKAPPKPLVSLKKVVCLLRASSDQPQGSHDGGPEHHPAKEAELYKDVQGFLQEKAERI
jgi:hypothetical protein